MFSVECPWCEGPATIEIVDDAFECAECVVRVELAPQPTTEPIARAA